MKAVFFVVFVVFCFLYMVLILLSLQGVRFWM